MASKGISLILIYPLCIFFMIIGSSKSIPISSMKYEDQLGKEASTYFAHRIAPLLVEFSNASLAQSTIKLQDSNAYMNNIIRESASIYHLDIGCDLCKEIVAVIDVLIQSDVSRDLIVEISGEVCKILKIEDDRVCDLVVREFQEEVIDVATLHYLSPDQVCGTLLGESCAVTYDPNADWNVTFPSIPKPPVTPVNPPKQGSPTLRILHISDLHIDRMYEVGSNTDCGEPICCRSNDGPPAPGVPGAGKWGDLRGCDASLKLMINTLEEISKTQKLDMIYMTGDLPAHDVWNQTRSDNIGVFNLVTDLFLKYFPGVKVYGALGNHESAPVNSFPPTDVIKGDQSETWLYNTMAHNWIDKAGWLPNATRANIQRGGYYDVLVYPGLRVVSLNSNAGNPMNWWLQINGTDPDSQLQWLIGVLQAAETAGEKVHILGHIPPSGTLPVWSKNYELIVKRYESTIRGQFFGHTHHDQFHLFYENVKTRRPINVVYVGGAITPDTQYPGYRVYTIDGSYANSTLAVLDHDNYYLNLTEANLTNKPVWRMEYQAKNAYNMTSLQPSEWNRVVDEMKSNTTIFNQYYRFFHRQYDAGPCDASCQARMICDIQTSRSGDSSYC
ncbi:sphingomyelin phosphodiesterase-like isoform X3 [Lytechinus variegatus]|nr:sphingomyelin phosphodiesterase-like isoform X3 [Lytechinus variegatus]XP_041480582.1 sphingomyelin phosphodiesterase-like isoform X3 [Lytechinus variegatus]